MRIGKLVMVRRIAALFSGGKDSTYSLHWAILQGMDVKCLITLKPLTRDSWMFHRPGIEVTKIQAKVLNIPQIFVETKGIKEEELKDLKEALRIAINRYRIEGIVAGALLSDYQRLRILSVANELGLQVYNPLWRKNQEKYMRELVKSGFKVLITSISAFGMPKFVVGKVLDEYLVELIIDRARKYKFNPAFEGGEAETLVVDAPLFREEIMVYGDVVEYGDYEAEFIIRDIKLRPKYFSS